MAGSVNKAILIGNLGQDPEMRYIQSGDPVATFSLATSNRWTGQDGQPREQTEWHTIVCWRKLAEQANEFLAKGRKVYVEGRIQTRSWDGQDGQKHYKTEIVANSFIMLDRAPQQNGGDYEGYTENVLPE